MTFISIGHTCMYSTRPVIILRTSHEINVCFKKKAMSLSISNVPVGFFDIRLESDTLEVYALYVDPDLKRSGIGRKLWAAVEERAVDMAANAIGLDADPSAVVFYKAMGCDVIGQSPSGSIPGRMLPRMCKWL